MSADDSTDQPGIVHRVVGGEIEPVLRPLLGVLLLQGIAESAQASYDGLWSLRALGATSAELGLAFAGAAVASVITGIVGGRLSDRVGRRPPILVGSAALAALTACLAFVGQHVALGLGVLVLIGGAIGLLFGSQRALLTDLVPRDRHDHAFAAQRIVQNIGYVAGPLVGAALLTVGWRALFLGIAAIALLAFIVALQAIPRSAQPDADGSVATWSLLALLRTPSFTVLLLAGTLAAMVYVSYETLLPISLVQSHGVAPAAWGILLSLNPIVVVVCQFRLSARVARVNELARLSIGIAAMGTPFLLVEVSTALPLLVLMLLLFVLGEMLWGPPAQSIIARLAPDDMRGAYFGATGASLPAALALGPLIGLQVRGAFGDTAMWVCIAIIGGLAIALYAAAERLAGQSAG
jgi:MFS family permease